MTENDQPTVRGQLSQYERQTAEAYLEDNRDQVKDAGIQVRQAFKQVYETVDEQTDDMVEAIGLTGDWRGLQQVLHLRFASKHVADFAGLYRKTEDRRRDELQQLLDDPSEDLASSLEAYGEHDDVVEQLDEQQDGKDIDDEEVYQAVRDVFPEQDDLEANLERVSAFEADLLEAIASGFAAEYDVDPDEAIHETFRDDIKPALELRDDIRHEFFDGAYEEDD